MVLVVIALAVVLIALVLLILKNRDEVNEHRKRTQELLRTSERAKEQQSYREVQHKREMSDLHKQKDADHQQVELRYRQEIGELRTKQDTDRQRADSLYKQETQQLREKFDEDRQRIEAAYKDQINLILEKESKQQEKLVELQAAVNQLAQEQCQAWIQTQCDAIKQEQREIANREASAVLEQWKIENEYRIRQDAIRKNHAVNLGKITEHFIPFLPGFDYNPKDARFIGSPIDYVVFDGMDEGEVRKIVFVEVKSSTPTLTKRQRQIRDAINSNRCEWKLIGLEEAKKKQEEILFQTAP